VITASLNTLHPQTQIITYATPYLPKQLLRLSYTALIHFSILNTAARSMHLLPKHISKNWMLSRKKAARIIYEVPPETHAEPLLILLHLDSVSNRREDQIDQYFHLRKMSSGNDFVCDSATGQLSRYTNYKALELTSAEEDLEWLALPCSTTDLVSVQTQEDL